MHDRLLVLHHGSIINVIVIRGIIFSSSVREAKGDTAEIIAEEAKEEEATALTAIDEAEETDGRQCGTIHGAVGPLNPCC